MEASSAAVATVANGRRHAHTSRPRPYQHSDVPMRRRRGDPRVTRRQAPGQRTGDHPTAEADREDARRVKRDVYCALRRVEVQKHPGHRGADAPDGDQRLPPRR
jgi:hypothetical protein